MYTKPGFEPQWREEIYDLIRGRIARVLCALSAVIVSGWMQGAHAQADERYDLVILNGHVIDPESRLDAVRSIGIRDGAIAAIAEKSLRGKQTLDAQGSIVAPGFIDLHAHGQQLPAARMQAFDGVTTALELESGVLPVSRFYDEIAAEGRPINYGASVSWAAARYAVINDLAPAAAPKNLDEMFKSDTWARAFATPQESERMLAHLEQELRAGALGIGVLLGYAPSSSHKEYHAVNQLAAAHGVPTFTHVRHSSAEEPGSAFQAHQEIIATAAATGAQMHIHHLNSTSLRDIPSVAEMISSAQKQGLPISIEAYPYSAASTMIGSAFFRGPHWQERLGGVKYEDFTVAGVALDEQRFLVLQREKPDTVIVFRYLRPDLNPRDEEYLDTSVLYPGGAIASDGVWWTHEGRRVEGDVWPVPAAAHAHPRSAGTFSRLLRVYVRERGKLTFMEAIEKASLIPARILERSAPQMKNKGRIRVGADADIIVFDPDTVADRATFEKPAVTSTGMRHVIVNGTPVIANGKLIRSALPGKAIRRAVPSASRLIPSPALAGEGLLPAK